MRNRLRTDSSILKQRFPASSRKSIVRRVLIISLLTIVDSHVFKEDSFIRIL